MTQEKMKKIITACVSAATVLLVMLLSFLIYQWITIAVLNKRIDEIEEENARYEEMVKEGEPDLNWYESLRGKVWLAIHKGWVRPEE